jgi:hypothetical protein
MIHSFDTTIAQKYGVNAAIILNNILFWLEKNKANETNFYDDFYWTYNSVTAWEKLFPYLTKKQIRTAIDILVAANVLKKGCYNKSKYDRTSWYSIIDEAIFQNTKPFALQDNCELPVETNEIVQKGEPIPDLNTYTNTDINKEDKSEFESTSIDEPDFVFQPLNIIEESYSNKKRIRESQKDLMNTSVNLPIPLFRRAELSGMVAKLNLEPLDELELMASIFYKYDRLKIDSEQDYEQFKDSLRGINK